MAAVHRHADTFFVSLFETVDLKPEHEGLAVVYTDYLPPEDCTVIVEPRIVTARLFFKQHKIKPFKNSAVARTLAMWHAFDGSVVIQIANPSADSIRLHPSLCLGHCPPCLLLLPINYVSTLSRIAPSLMRIFAAPGLTLRVLCLKRFLIPTSPLNKKNPPLTLCAKHRSVFSLSMSDLGRCTIAEATFPVPPGTCPVDRPPYRANPSTSAVIAKCVNEMCWGGE